MHGKNGKLLDYEIWNEKVTLFNKNQRGMFACLPK